MPRIHVLYEDSRAANTKNYGPHVLVKQLLCDRLDKQPWELKGVLEANPRRGAHEVRKTCLSDLNDLATGGQTVVAVYDSDEAHTVCQMAATACKGDIAAALKKDCEPAERLIVVLLERNIESVLRALRELDSKLATDAEWTAAIDQKKPTPRDTILEKASKPSTTARATRDRLIEKSPSLARLVRRLVALF